MQTEPTNSYDKKVDKKEINVNKNFGASISAFEETKGEENDDTRVRANEIEEIK